VRHADRRLAPLARPTAPPRQPRSCRPFPDRVAPPPDSHRPDRRCPSRVAQTAAGRAAAAASSRPPSPRCHRRRRLRTGEPPPPRRSVRWRRAAAPCAARMLAPCVVRRARHRLRPWAAWLRAVPRVAVGRASAAHAGRAPRGHRPRTRCARGPSRCRGVGHAHCASGPNANSAQCTRLNIIKF
jgi:hypothetical protein